MLRIILLILWEGLIIFAGYIYFHFDINIDDVRSYMQNTGYISWLFYIIAYSLRSLIFFPPSLMTGLAVILYGPIWGWVFAYIGENISANVAFKASKFMGRKWVKEKEPKIIKKYEKRIEREGFFVVLMLRLLPIFPFDLVNYLFGLTSIKQWKYSIATLIGVIPGLTAYVLIFSGITDNPWYLVIGGILIGGLTLFAHFYKKKY